MATYIFIFVIFHLIVANSYLILVNFFWNIPVQKHKSESQNNLDIYLSRSSVLHLLLKTVLQA